MGRKGKGKEERNPPNLVPKFLYSGLTLSLFLSFSLSLPGYVEATLDAVPPGDKPLPATELPRNIDRAFR